MKSFFQHKIFNVELGLTYLKVNLTKQQRLQNGLAYGIIFRKLKLLIKNINYYGYSSDILNKPNPNLNSKISLSLTIFGISVLY